MTVPFLLGLPSRLATANSTNKRDSQIRLSRAANAETRGAVPAVLVRESLAREASSHPQGDADGVAAAGVVIGT